jgi:Serine aminopeptidase, S33
MLNTIAQFVVFRPPKPASYSEDSLWPKMYYARTRVGTEIPICVDYPGSSMRRRSFMNDPSRNWILFSHGNAEDLDNVTRWTTQVCDFTNLMVVSYDYSGYGLSRITTPQTLDATNSSITNSFPNENAVYADAEAALEFAESVLELKREKAILWGRSLGGSANCHLACLSKRLNRPVAGVILQATFTSIAEVIVNYHLTEPPSWEMFRNYDKIKESGGFDSPCFVIHGLNDWTVNWWHGSELALQIPERYRWPPLFVDCGHNDLEHGFPRFLSEINEFIHYCILCSDNDA